MRAIVTMETVDSLQAIINKRAAAKLDTDLAAISTFVKENRILAQTDRGMPELTFNLIRVAGEEPATKKLTPFWLFQYAKSGMSNYSSSSYMDQLRALWLPVYIQEETALFVEKVDKVREDVDYLLDQQD